MQIVIPMAGLGQRFRDVGYTTPKPLLPVDGEPMVVRVVRDLPTAERVVFVVHPDHLAQYQIDRQLQQHFPGCHIIPTPGLTQGQACSVRLAAPALDLSQPVCVAACDNTHRYNAAKLTTLTNESKADCLIWTYRGERRVLDNPHWYGWVQTRQERVERVSVKKPISQDLLRDHVVSGTFWFRTARQMIDGIDALVASGKTVNNEFYLDAVPDLLVQQGRDVRVFEVDQYIGWGTPADYEDYQRGAQQQEKQHAQRVA